VPNPAADRDRVSLHPAARPGHSRLQLCFPALPRIATVSIRDCVSRSRQI
jgi:hypothetical protein